MIEQEAKVIALDGDYARISISQQSACGSCAAKSGCGTSVVASLFPQRQQTLSLINTIGARPNDRVLIGLPESGLQRASLLLYGVPLLGLLAGAIVGQSWGGSEPQAILGGLLGILLGLGVVRWRATRSTGLAPVLIRRLPVTGISISNLQLGSS